MAYRDIALVVDALPGMGDGVAIVEASPAVVDDLHPPTDDIAAHDGVTAHFNPHNGQVGRVDDHRGIVGREIGVGLRAERKALHQQHQQYDEPWDTFHKPL